jgi:hypothetical protein
MLKKNGKLRVCIGFRDLNKAMPMDGYPMPIADLFVDATSGNKVISFMDHNIGYNQIFMAKEASLRLLLGALGLSVYMNG